MKQNESMGAWIAALSREVKQSSDFHWLWRIVAWPVGLYLYFHFCLIRWTSKTEIFSNQSSAPSIYVNWHRHLPYLIQHHGKHRRWLMVSRSSYMEPIARWCRLSGLKLARGASGHGGSTALNELKHSLIHGESVMLAVDGPAGPGFKVKRGCIELAQETGCPIVPVSYSVRRGKEVKKRWDKTLIPKLFDLIQIRYGTPIYVDSVESLESTSKIIELALNNLDPAIIG